MSAHFRIRFRIATGALAALLLCAAPASGREGPTLRERLERLESRLEQARVDEHVPGCAIAVVRGDEVVLVRGFGLADRDSARPADADTRFAIGSTTKAMTATLIARLVDQGKMSFDQPVRAYLPDFRLADAQAGEAVTIRDLLCHRAGLGSLNVLWYGTSASAEDILGAVARAELLHPFRERWAYSNISYLVAGLASAEAAGAASWHALVREGLLGPLGIEGATTRAEEALADPAMAVGYSWNGQKQAWTALALRPVDAVAPAGSINASAREMAQWLRFQLGRGAIGGQRLLSEQTFLETWEPQIEMRPDVEYALGWAVTQWKGRPLLCHTGGIDGFSAQVALLPDDGVAFALLMNLSSATLAETSLELVFDAMVSEWSPDAPAPDEDLSRFTGTYLGNFGEFDGAAFEVLVRNGRLAIDVPGQTVYELLPPEADAKRPFAMTDQIKIRFNESERGEVHSLTLFQAGYRFELPREGVEQPCESVDMAAVRPMLGSFRFDELGVDVEVLVRDGRLALNVPGQTVYDLLPPDGEGRWVFRVKDSIWVTFNKDGKTGEVSAITLVQDGAESVLARVQPAPRSDLPTVDALLAAMREARGGDAIDAIDAIRGTGRMRMVHAGVEGSVAVLATGEGWLRSETDLGPFGRVLVVASPERVWIDAPFASEHDQDEQVAEALRLDSPLSWLADWRSRGEVALLGRAAFDGREAYEVRVKTALGNSSTWYIDAGTKLPVARRSTHRTPLGAAVEATTRYGDFQEVGGVLFPFLVTTENEHTGRVEIRYETIEANPRFEPAEFQAPAR